MTTFGGSGGENFTASDPSPPGTENPSCATAVIRLELKSSVLTSKTTMTTFIVIVIVIVIVLVDGEAGDPLAKSVDLLSLDDVTTLEVQGRLELACEPDTGLQGRVVRPQIRVPVTIACSITSSLTIGYPIRKLEYLAVYGRASTHGQKFDPESLCEPI